MPVAGRCWAGLGTRGAHSWWELCNGGHGDHAGGEWVPGLATCHCHAPWTPATGVSFSGGELEGGACVLGDGSYTVSVSRHSLLISMAHRVDVMPDVSPVSVLSWSSVASCFTELE